MTPTRGDTRGDMATTALLAGATEILRKIPGAATTMTVVQEVFRRRAEQRALELFTAIGVATGAADPEEAAARLARDIDEPWCQEAIEAGFRELMNCTDSAIRRCLGFLVAEYVVMRRPPDLKFRRAGAVLQACAGDNLSTLLTVTNGYKDVVAGAGPGLRVLVRSTGRPDAAETFSVAAWTAPHGDVKGHMRASAEAPMAPDFEDCTRALVNGGVGRPWTGLSSAQFQGDPIIHFDAEDDAAMQLLDVCVRTGFRPRKDGPDRENA